MAFDLFALFPRVTADVLTLALGAAARRRLMYTMAAAAMSATVTTTPFSKGRYGEDKD
jgi:hypothetical protein